MIARSARYLRALALLVLIALGAAVVQGRLPISLLWGALDVVIHGTLAAICSVGSLPRWGSRTVWVAVAAGVLIDLDHLVAAGSADPMAMMTLPWRPPTHSLLGVLGLAVLIGLLSRWRYAYAALVGMLAHLLWDCVSPPGVVLFYPFLEQTLVVLPLWAVLAGLLVLSGTTWWVGRPRVVPRRSQIETLPQPSGHRR